jgi:putative endonuclease
VSKLSVGKSGEDIAVQFLRKKGMRILERNFRTPFGEIDIIGKIGKTVHFVEVKTRKSEKYGKPFEAVNKIKLEHIEKSAAYYIQQNKQMRDYDIEIDVVSILMKEDGKEIEFIENVF